MLKMCYPPGDEQERNKLKKKYEERLAHIRILYKNLDEELKKAKKELELLNSCK